MSTLVNGVNKEQTQWILSLVVRPARTDTKGGEEQRSQAETETDTTKNNCEHFRNMFGADRDTDGC